MTLFGMKVYHHNNDTLFENNRKRFAQTLDVGNFPSPSREGAFLSNENSTAKKSN